MGLRFSFRHLFYGGKIHKDRLYKVLEDLDAASGGDTSEVERKITALEARIKALEDKE